MNLVVIGAGYVGLVSAACLAYIGHRVTCVEIDIDKCQALQNGQSTLHEEGLDDILRQVTGSGQLSFVTNLDEVTDCEVAFIAVGTPFNHESNNTDTSFLYKAVQDLVDSFANQDDLFLVIKSTVPVGTGDKIQPLLPDNVRIISNPEFLKQGQAVNDFMHPDRIIVGVGEDSGKDRDIMSDIYRPLIENDTPILFMNKISAEIVKYAANGFLATKVAFANEISYLCGLFNASSSDVIKGITCDQRIGSNHFVPGPGFGGSCFPKDGKELERLYLSQGMQKSIISTVIQSNLNVMQKILNALHNLAKQHAACNIAILGVTFKSDTDDVRESPALFLIQGLNELGYSLQIYDPHGMDNAKKALANKDRDTEHDNQQRGQITWCDSIYEAGKACDMVVVATEWKEFISVDLQQLYDVCAKHVMVDLRNIYDKDVLDQGGWECYNLDTIYQYTCSSTKRKSK